MSPKPCKRCGVVAREGLLCYACAKAQWIERREWPQIAAQRRRDRIRKRQLRELDRHEHGQLTLTVET